MKLSFVGVLLGITLNALVSYAPAEAALCMCHPTSCVIINANNSVLSQAGLHCPAQMVNINDLLVLRYIEPSLMAGALAPFTNLTSLEMFQGSLGHIVPGAFENVPNLFKLIIRNNMVNSLEDNTFQGLDGLQILYLISNGLSSVSPNAFNGLKNLTHLILSGNKITQLPMGLFSGTPELRSITLASNMLSDLPPSFFDGVTGLYRLDLSKNLLTSFEFPKLKVTILFLNNNSLTKLHLGEDVRIVKADMNRIETITGSGLNITDLLLSDNAISDISSIKGMPLLTKLSLSNNPLRPDSNFSGFPQLQELLLSHTNIQVNEQTFANLSHLHLLDLSYNNLTELDFTKFSSMIELKNLLVAFNHIDKINFIELREYLPELRLLEICGNGWNSTYMERMLEHMRRYKLKADMQGLSHTLRYSATFVDLCSSGPETSTKSSSDDDDYYSEDISDIINQDIAEFYPSTSTSTLRNQPVVESTRGTTTAVPLTEPMKNAVPTTPEPTVKFISAGVMAEVDPVTPADQQPVVGSSPLYITFQVLVYTFSIFGVVCLVVLGYYMRQRRFDVHRITPVDNTDSLRLV